MKYPMKSSFVLLVGVMLLSLMGCSNKESELTGALDVEFSLMNEKGEKTNEFSEGENIIFRMEIKNSSDDDVVLAHTNIADILGHNAFRVYTIDGKDMGTPWDDLIDDYLGAFVLSAHQTRVAECPWMNTSGLTDTNNENTYSGLFIKNRANTKLSTGEYYSEFNIKLGNEDIVCKQAFNIK